MKQIDDDELRACFGKLREHDAAHVPDFRVMRQRAKSRRSRMSPSLGWIAVAASLVLGVGFTVRWTRERDSAAAGGPRTTENVVSWRSPTAGLLNTPGRELLAPPPILSSVFDGATRGVLPRKGD